MTDLSALKKKKKDLAAVNARVPKELKERADAALKLLNISYVDLITHALNLAIAEAEKAKPTKSEVLGGK